MLVEKFKILALNPVIAVNVILGHVLTNVYDEPGCHGLRSYHNLMGTCHVFLVFGSMKMVYCIFIFVREVMGKPFRIGHLEDMMKEI